MGKIGIRLVARSGRGNGMEKKKSHKQMVKELDQMPKDVTSDEADFLEEVIDTFEDGKKLKPKMAQRLEDMYGKYLGVKDSAGDESGEEEDADRGEEEEGDSDELE